MSAALRECSSRSGTIAQFGIPLVVIGKASDFPGNPCFLREHGVEVVVLDNPECTGLMARFIAERPDLWFEDIARTEWTSDLSGDRQYSTTPYVRWPRRSGQWD